MQKGAHNSQSWSKRLGEEEATVTFALFDVDDSLDVRERDEFDVLEVGLVGLVGAAEARRLQADHRGLALQRVAPRPSLANLQHRQHGKMRSQLTPETFPSLNFFIMKYFINPLK